MTTFVPYGLVLEHFPETQRPSLRRVREIMLAHGLLVRDGRTYLTTQENLRTFLEHVKEFGLCKPTGRQGQLSSLAKRKAGGTAVARSRCAPRPVLPADALNSALAKLSKLKPSARRSATS